MCGIVGIAGQNLVADRELLLHMRDSMLHRGPDDAGIWWDEEGKVGLAHRRLAIIDLSCRAHQPMTEPTEQLWIVFNGEIYNFRQLRQELISMGHSFRTQSDTEVILEAYRAWGSDCLSHFNGMFAFALYDRALRRLFVARDRAGQKPLFYYHLNGRFVFAAAA